MSYMWGPDSSGCAFVDLLQCHISACVTCLSITYCLAVSQVLIYGACNRPGPDKDDVALIIQVWPFLSVADTIISHTLDQSLLEWDSSLCS